MVTGFSSEGGKKHILEKMLILLIIIFYAHWVLIRKWERELLEKIIPGILIQLLISRWKVNAIFLENHISCRQNLFPRLLLEIIWKIIWFDLNQSLLIIPSKNDNHPRSYMLKNVFNWSWRFKTAKSSCSHTRNL